MANHSPGEFQLADSGTPFIYALDADTGVNRFSAIVEGGYTRRGKTSAEELMANARLFAASPKLLNVCEILHARLFREQNGQENSKWASALKILSEAIAEAKGK